MKTDNIFASVIIMCTVSILVASCLPKNNQEAQQETEKSVITDENPAMPDFNAAASDENAIDIADKVMKAMGGRKNWDETHYLVWDFFGSRRLFWDKKEGNVRIESLKNDLKIIVNIHDLTGKVFKDGEELTNQDSIQHYLNRGKSMWINDSYWLVMPFKLKDSGVSLTYERPDTLPGGQSANVLALTFENVGDTPQNKYEVYVDQQDHLIKQWAFFREATQDSASFIRPWDNYKSYRNLLLSSDRSDNGGPTNAMVLSALPASVFDSWQEVDVSKLAGD